jgi:hypothetical protein
LFNINTFAALNTALTTRQANLRVVPATGSRSWPSGSPYFRPGVRSQ